MIKTDALVLRRSRYRDSDRMVTLFSPEMGKLEAVARGCLKAKSPLMNATELFTAGEYVFSDNRGRLTMTQCRITESFYPLRQDMDRLMCGSYIVHLLNGVTLAGEANRELFIVSLKALAHIAYSDVPLAVIIMMFELKLLDLLGIAPEMSSCVICQKPLSGDTRFDPSLGGCACPECLMNGPVITKRARQVIRKLPKVDFDAAEKVTEVAEWKEAALRTREFMLYRLDIDIKLIPPIDEVENV